MNDTEKAFHERAKQVAKALSPEALEELRQTRRGVEAMLGTKDVPDEFPAALKRQIHELIFRALSWELVATEYRLGAGWFVEQNTKRIAELHALLGSEEEQLMCGYAVWEATRAERDERERLEGWVTS